MRTVVACTRPRDAFLSPPTGDGNAATLGSCGPRRRAALSSSVTEEKAVARVRAAEAHEMAVIYRRGLLAAVFHNSEVVLVIVAPKARRPKQFAWLVAEALCVCVRNGCVLESLVRHLDQPLWLAFVAVSCPA